MPKRIIFFSAVLIILAGGTSFIQAGSKAELTGLAQEIVISAPSGVHSRAACAFQKHNDTANSFYSGFDPGDRIVTYFEPSVECSSPTYPFEIQSFSITLFDGGGYQWPVDIDIVVFALAGADSCSGPGAELCRFTVSCDSAVFRTPHVGTATFPTPCCVIGPVYIGYEYSDDGAGEGPFPSVLFDISGPVPRCENWGYGLGSWSEWYNFWGPPRPGYPLYWVEGETQSAACGLPCCIGNRGDVNGDGTDANILDLNYTVNRIFRGGPAAPCPQEGDVNADGTPTNILDLTFLVDRIFRSGPAPGACI